MPVNAIQHIGIGVKDTDKTLAFYRELGFSVKLNDMTGPNPGMKPVLGDVLDMRLTMVMNLGGGGVIETVEHTSTPIRPHPAPVRWGDLGYFGAGFRAHNLPAIVEKLKAKGLKFETPVLTWQTSAGQTWRQTFLKDPDDLLVHLLELPEDRDRKPRVCGLNHVLAGVRDLDRSQRFFAEMAGFDRVLHEFEGRLPELDGLSDGPVTMKMRVLERSAGCTSPFKVLYGGMLFLVQVTDRAPRVIFEGRRWGDIGLMEFALDGSDLDRVFQSYMAKGAPQVIPPTFMDMGTGSQGRFCYVSDPDGNIMETVEVQKVFWVSPGVFMTLMLPLLKLIR